MSPKRQDPGFQAVKLPIDDKELWRERSKLDPLAAVLDPADELGRKNAYIHEVHSSALRRFADLRRGDHVLDFGCGNGRMSELLASRAAKVTGVDVSPEMIEAARELRDHERCEFVAYDGKQLPFEDEAFDAAISVVVLQIFCPEPQRFREVVTEIARVLRPGARVSLIERTVPPPGGDEWTPQQWRSGLEACGLRVANMRPIRTGNLTPLATRALSERFPRWLIGTAARMDLTSAARRGTQPPYTECLFEAKRV